MLRGQEARTDDGVAVEIIASGDVGALVDGVLQIDAEQVSGLLHLVQREETANERGCA